jgi:galactosylceramidase
LGGGTLGQSTTLGWSFLQHGMGVGLLDNGGSYAALTDTTEQTATFQLDSSFAHITQLFVFFSNLSTIDVEQAFIYKGIVLLNKGVFTLQLPVEVIYTLSTINGTKGAYAAPPASTPFPLPYKDDFNQYPINSEAALFADQSGSWQIVDTFSSRG